MCAVRVYNHRLGGCRLKHAFISALLNHRLSQYKLKHAFVTALLNHRLSRCKTCLCNRSIKLAPGVSGSEECIRLLHFVFSVQFQRSSTVRDVPEPITVPE